jgi:hypothetical protein
LLLLLGEGVVVVVVAVEGVVIVVRCVQQLLLLLLVTGVRGVGGRCRTSITVGVAGMGVFILVVLALMVLVDDGGVGIRGGDVDEND